MGSASTSLRFATAARGLAEAARRHGLAPPSFRSPPRLAGATRTLRRRRDGAVSVAIVIRERPWPAVMADMVEGVVAANGLDGLAADQVRTALWRAVELSSEGRAA